MKKHNSRIQIIFILLFLTLISSTACQITPGDETVSESTYYIGWLGALTGTGTQWGEPALRAANIALDDVNNDGGINGKELAFIIEDTQSLGSITATAAKKVIEVDDVPIIFTHSSIESLAAAPIAEQSGTILFGSATSTPDLTDAGDYIFRVTPVNREGELIAKTLNDEGYDKIAVITEQTKYTTPIRDAIVRNYNGEIIVDEIFLSDDVDVRTIVTKIKSGEVDAVVLLPFDLTRIMQLIQMLKEQDVDAQIFGNAAFNTGELIESLGDSAEGMKFATLFIDDNDPKIASFVQRYEGVYGPIPNKAHTLDAASKIYIIADALRDCNEDISCVKQYLYDIKGLETVSGTLTIDENGDADKKFSLKEVQNGEIIFTS